MKPYSSVLSNVWFEDRKSLLLSMNHEELQHTLKGEQLQVQVGVGQVARETPGKQHLAAGKGRDKKVRHKEQR
jgi:hypothetical protein